MTQCCQAKKDLDWLRVEFVRRGWTVWKDAPPPPSATIDIWDGENVWFGCRFVTFSDWVWGEGSNWEDQNGDMVPAATHWCLSGVEKVSP